MTVPASTAPAPFIDPLVDPTSLPPAMVAAALSRPDGAVAVLAGTRLSTWIQDQIDGAVVDAIRAARDTWNTETQELIAAATAAAATATTDRFANLAATIAQLPNTTHDDLNSATKARHNVLLPEATWQAVKATAATRGLSIQDALTEAAQAWVVAQRTTTPNTPTAGKDA